MVWNLSKSPPRWKVHSHGLCTVALLAWAPTVVLYLQTHPRTPPPPLLHTHTPPLPFRKWKWYGQLMLPNVSWPQVLSWGRSWAGLQDWGCHHWRLITALWCWHFGMVDPSAGRASSHLSLSVVFKGLSTACNTEPRSGKKDAMAPLWLYFTYFNGTSVQIASVSLPHRLCMLSWTVLSHNKVDHSYIFANNSKWTNSDTY